MIGHDFNAGMRSIMADRRLPQAVEYLKNARSLGFENFVAAVARGDVVVSSEVKGFFDDLGTNAVFPSFDDQGQKQGLSS